MSQEVVIILFMLVAAILLMGMGIPVGFAFGFASFVLVFWLGLDLRIYLPAAFRWMQGFTLVAIPLYMLAGDLMQEIGQGAQIMRFAQSIVGRFRGGLMMSYIITHAIFGVVSGAAASAVGALGPLFAPTLKEHGYSRGHIVAVTASGALLSLLLPPGITLIIFGIAANLSIGTLFIAAIIPSLVVVLLLLILTFFYSRGNTNIVLSPKMSFTNNVKEIGRSTKAAVWALLMPVFVLGGIYTGFWSPTEAAAVAIVYCLLIDVAFTRLLTIKKIGQACLRAATITGLVGIVFFFFYVMNQIMILERIPDQLASVIALLSDNPYIILLLLNAVMVIMGMFMTDVSGLILAGVILMPIAVKFGIDPYHFGVIVTVNLALGLLTPPVATTLYLSAAVCGDVPFKEYIKPTLVYLLGGYLPALILVTYIPALSLWPIEFFSKFQ